MVYKRKCILDYVTDEQSILQDIELVIGLGINTRMLPLYAALLT